MQTILDRIFSERVAFVLQRHNIPSPRASFCTKDDVLNKFFMFLPQPGTSSDGEVAAPQKAWLRIIVDVDLTPRMHL